MNFLAALCLTLACVIGLAQSWVFERDDACDTLIQCTSTLKSIVEKYYRKELTSADVDQICVAAKAADGCIDKVKNDCEIDPIVFETEDLIDRAYGICIDK